MSAWNHFTMAQGTGDRPIVPYLLRSAIDFELQVVFELKFFKFW